MPNSNSAKKRVRQSASRRARNRWRKSEIHTQIKAVMKAVHDHDKKTAESEFRKACGLIDKVASSSTMHKNTAARKKSRLVRHLKSMKKK